MKKLKTSAVLTAAVIAGAALFSGCSVQQGMELAQTKEYGEEVRSITMDFDESDVTVLESTDGKITFKEYLSQNKKSFRARLSLSGGALSITEGARPRMNKITSRIELLLPSSYNGKLAVHATSGAIVSQSPLTFTECRMDTTSGSITAAGLSAQELELSTASGTIFGQQLSVPLVRVQCTGGKLELENIVADSCAVETTNTQTTMRAVHGRIDYRTTGGGLSLTGASGSGVFRATGDGALELAFADVSGDIEASAKNGGISLALPQPLAFHFTASAKEGAITTSFTEELTIEEHSASGRVGENPSLSVTLETRNGDINVSR